MPDWDENSDRLQENLQRLIHRVGHHASARKPVTLDEIKKWHVTLMEGLITDPAYVGAFRGERGVEDVNVRVGLNVGVDAEKVADAVRRFERLLQVKIARLDQAISPGSEPGNAELGREVIELCAWAHAEWVRLHPFVNGNGRTARLIANCLAMRYGFPPFVQLRPRPGMDYGAAGARAMQSDWKSTVPVFHVLLKDFLKRNPPPD